MKNVALLTLMLALPAGASAQSENASTASQIRLREDLRPFHMIAGSLTGAATYATTLLGFLTFHDRYGWDGDPSSTGCAQGSPVLGADLCEGPPWPHLVLSSTMSLFFATAFTIALFMPDPLGVAEQRTQMGTLLSAHKALRWALLALIVSQIFLGVVTANIDADFDTRRGLAIGHLALGAATWATMTTQGIMGSMMAW